MSGRCSMTKLFGFFAVFTSCLLLSDGKAPEADACVGMRRGEGIDFGLPDAVVINVQTDICDAEWSVDQYTAIMDGHTTKFSFPFNNVTANGISVKLNYCPVSVKYHVSCHVFTGSLTCSCMNSTNTTKSVSTTTLSYTDAFTPWSSGYNRNHYAVCAVVVGGFCLILIFIWRTKRGSAADQNHPDSSV